MVRAQSSKSQHGINIRTNPNSQSGTFLWPAESLRHTSCSLAGDDL